MTALQQTAINNMGSTLTLLTDSGGNLDTKLTNVDNIVTSLGYLQQLQYDAKNLHTKASTTPSMAALAADLTT